MPGLRALRTGGSGSPLETDVTRKRKKALLLSLGYMKLYACTVFFEHLKSELLCFKEKNSKVSNLMSTTENTKSGNAGTVLASGEHFDLIRRP